MAEKSICQNCGKTWDDAKLKLIHHIFERVAPGEPMPSGECPECGALCQPVEKETAKDLVAKLVMSQFDEAKKLADDHARWEYQRGYFEGLEAGEERGYALAQNEMRRALGLLPLILPKRRTIESFAEEAAQKQKGETE